MLTIAIVGVLICASSVMRIVMQVNTINQVVLGVLLGIWLACLFGFVLREPIFEHVEALIDDYYDMKWFGRIREIAAVTFVSMVAVPLICLVIVETTGGSIFYQQAI